MRKLILATGLFFLSLMAVAQFPRHYSSSELLHQLKKLENTATVLYMAAHPDDENTRLISYFENELHARVAYLSLTRGDGGQNLIGTEIGAAIGLLRTQELLQARSIDGGEQFFTRAVDFGYSKSADETLEKWGREMVLADVVWVIRKFRPDVIVTRFPPTNYAGHGHHQASAMLAEEAFDLAADPNAFPEQLEYVDVWQPQRLYFNTSTWWVKDLEDQAQNSDEYLTVDVGVHNYLLGESYGQIAARSRSQHRSQGFGSDYPYGTQVEFMKYVKGDKADPYLGILGGIEQTWERYGLQEIDTEIDEIIASFDPERPQYSAVNLSRIANKIKNISELDYKRSEINTLIMRLTGLSATFTTDRQYAVRGEKIMGRIEINNSSDLSMKLLGIEGKGVNLEPDLLLDQNDRYSEELELLIAASEPFSIPYWLKSKYKDLYEVNSYENLGKPENDPSIELEITVDVEGYLLSFKVPLMQKEVDPAEALLLDPVYIVPHVTCSFSEKALISTGGEPRKTYLTLTNHSNRYSGEIKLNLPPGWNATPPSHNIALEGYGDDVMLEFDIYREKNALPGIATVTLIDNSGQLKDGITLEEIKYPHIPSQVMIQTAELRLQAIEIDRGSTDLIGYIDGPGDEVAKYLRAAGYEVESITPENLKSEEAISKYDAIVTGIRAFNTREDLSFANAVLNEYVENGGTWIVQYNTSRGLKSDQIGPYSFTISRERVTDEFATPTFLDPSHPVFNTPNKLDNSDFDGWVQERGLYFANEWSSEFSPLISWSDDGEPPRDGGLIVAPHGKGTFIYTGISFFRELPAGVPGAYRLMANLLNLSNKSDE
jgi:LmbE family N-acetylglucosaminyl deacetylase